MRSTMPDIGCKNSSYIDVGKGLQDIVQLLFGTRAFHKFFIALAHAAVFVKARIVAQFAAELRHQHLFAQGKAGKDLRPLFFQLPQKRIRFRRFAAQSLRFGEPDLRRFDRLFVFAEGFVCICESFCNVRRGLLPAPADCGNSSAPSCAVPPRALPAAAFGSNFSLGCSASSCCGE